MEMILSEKQTSAVLELICLVCIRLCIMVKNQNHVNRAHAIGTDYVVPWRRYCDHYVMTYNVRMWVSVWMCTIDRNDLKPDTVVVIDYASQPVEFWFKRLRVRVRESTPICICREWTYHPIHSVVH